MAILIILNFEVFAIDLEIIHRVWACRNKYGFSLDDIAFLTDSDINLLKAIEDPTRRITAKTAKMDKNGEYYLPKESIARYDLELFDFIRAIFFNESIDTFLPSVPLTEDKVTAQANCIIERGVRKLFIMSYNADGKEVAFYNYDKKLVSKISVKYVSDNDRIKKILEGFLFSGYFTEPKMAINIFRDIYSEYAIICKPVALRKVLRFFTSKRKSPRLKRYRLKNGHEVYEADI